MNIVVEEKKLSEFWVIKGRLQSFENAICHNVRYGSMQECVDRGWNQTESVIRVERYRNLIKQCEQLAA